MRNSEVFLQLYARAPAPLRDYYGLTINDKEVILNIWNITHGPHVFPRRLKCLLRDFETDRTLTSAVGNFFGSHVLQYSLGVARRDPKLQNLPSKIFLYILRHLATKDILSLGQSSKIFFELCNGEAAWKMIFGRRRPKVEDPRRAKVPAIEASPTIGACGGGKKKVAFAYAERADGLSEIGDSVYVDMQVKFDAHFKQAEEALGLSDVSSQAANLEGFAVSAERKIKMIKKDHANGSPCKELDLDRNYYKVPEKCQAAFNAKLSVCAKDNPKLKCLKFPEDKKKTLWGDIKSKVSRAEKQQKVVLNNAKVDNSTQQRTTKNNRLNEVKRSEAGFKLINNIKPKGILKKSNVNT